VRGGEGVKHALDGAAGDRRSLDKEGPTVLVAGNHRHRPIGHVVRRQPIDGDLSLGRRLSQEALHALDFYRKRRKAPLHATLRVPIDRRRRSDEGARRLRKVRRQVRKATRSGFLRLNKAAFEAAPSDSVDYVASARPPCTA